MYASELMDLLGFVPSDDWREANLVHARKEREEGEYQRCPYELPLVEEVNDTECLLSCQPSAWILK